MKYLQPGEHVYDQWIILICGFGASFSFCHDAANSVTLRFWHDVSNGVGLSGRASPFHKHWVLHVTNTREKEAPGTFIQTECGKIFTPWQHKSSCANYVSVNVNEKKSDEVLICSVYLFTFLPPQAKVWAVG